MQISWRITTYNWEINAKVIRLFKLDWLFKFIKQQIWELDRGVK